MNITLSGLFTFWAVRSQGSEHEVMQFLSAACFCLAVIYFGLAIRGFINEAKTV